MARSTATDVANHLVARRIYEGDPMDEPCLQRALYHAWVGYRRVHGERLFDEPFLAYRYGPVVGSVRRLYRRYVGMPLFRVEGGCDVDDDLAVFLDSIPDDLPNVTRCGITPWSVVYSRGARHREIPFDLIERMECRV